MKKISVGILGATGFVGQTYVRLLEEHPLFEIAYLSASPKWEGKIYREALSGYFCHPFSEKILNLKLKPPEPAPVIFSAVKGSLAPSLEFALAKEGCAIFSHSAALRKEDDIPVIIPEINADHLSLIDVQRKKRGWKGFIVVKPNCTVQSFLLPLYPLHQAYTLKKVCVTTMQATSGGGKDCQLEENILPYIEGEEEKSETEPLKILECSNEQIAFSVHSNRVPVFEGHLASVSATFEKPIEIKEVRKIWEEFSPLNLSFAPKSPLRYLHEEDRPQPLLDKNVGKGMSVALGRLRKCSIFDLRFVALSHNLIRGAAGGSLLVAELAKERGYLHG